MKPSLSKQGPTLHRIMSKQPTVKCPICGKESAFFSAPVGPFCSSRCKMIDLGGWLAEDYRISEPLRPEHFQQYEQLSGEDLDKPE